LALQPSFVVCDEVVSALDVSIQGQIIALLERLQEELGLTYVFIGHDLAVVRHLSHTVAVMYLGKLMEMAGSDELYRNPVHPYTRALLSASPIPDPKADRKRERIVLRGEIGHPSTFELGCRFCTRCSEAKGICFEKEPEFRQVGMGTHFAACHLI
jgi:oligopeptide transport system ATP-binding protein